MVTDLQDLYGTPDKQRQIDYRPNLPSCVQNLRENAYVINNKQLLKVVLFSC